MNRGGGESRSTSSFFGEDNIDSDCRTFSQLLAGVMSPPDTSIFGRIPWTSTYEQDHGGKAAAAPVFALTPGISPGALLDAPSSLLAPRPGNFSISHKEEPMKVNSQVSDSAFGAPDVDFVGSYRDSNFLYTLMEEKSIRTGATFPIQTNQGSSLAVDHSSEDGYNWKKYGQKSVKGSDCPRSYYKCTHPKCSVTKKVERSIEGQVNAIIYKGEHNHPKPHPKSIGHSQRHGEDFEMGMQSQLKIHEQSSDSGNEEGDNDEGSDSELDPKRRKTSSSANETVSSQSTVTKPKIVVHTRSDVDLLDDGYKWRKYGQKVVKGNCHPRSYYKCTSAGCNVRKHVERPSNEPTAVITTYEGKHNHTVPGAKNGIHKRADENSAVTEANFI